MPEFDKRNTGAVFKAEKGDNPKRPDMTGNADLECPHCGAEFEKRIAAWKREAAKTGQPFLSMKFSEKQAPATDSAVISKSADDIPF